MQFTKVNYPNGKYAYLALWCDICLDKVLNTRLPNANDSFDFRNPTNPIRPFIVVEINSDLSEIWIEEIEKT